MKTASKTLRITSLFMALAVALPACTTISPSIKNKETDIKSSLQDRIIPYKEFAKPSSNSFSANKEGAYAVHLEAGIKSEVSNKKLMARHPEAAAYSLYYGSVVTSGKNIKVEAYDINPFIGAALKSKNDDKVSRTVMEYALDNATAISLSMNTNSHYRMAFDRKDIPALYAQWKDSHAIQTQSAGNGGKRCHKNSKAPTQQHEFTFPQLADTYAKVGSSIVDPDSGEIKIKTKSSCSGADLIGLNPYLTGLKYRFLPTSSEFSRLYETYQENKDGVELKTLQATLQAKRKKHLDKDGYMTNIGGNSFVSTTVAGYFAGAKEICPALTEYDILGAAFAYAVPIASADDINFPYDNNGRIPHDDVRGGFGYIDETVYKQAIKKACKTLKQAPALATKEIQIEHHFNNLDPAIIALPKDQKAIQFTIPESALPFKIAMELESNSGGIPYGLTLISPNGAKVNLRPANANWQSPSWALTSTNGFFGTDTKGTWTIAFNDMNKSISAATIRISAVKHGGLVDKIIDQSIEHEKSNPAQPRSAIRRTNFFPANP